MQVNKFKKIVIKLGSSTVIDKKGKFKSAWVQSLIKDIKSLKKNIEVIVVSSGAIALGQNFLKIKKKKIKIENEISFIEINFRALDKFLSILENNNKSYPELDLILLKNKPNISIQKKSTYLSNKFKKTKK